MPNLVSPIHVQALARHSNARVHRRSQDWIEYSIGNYQFERVIVGGDLHYQDANGEWQEIDTDFTDSNEQGYVDGNVTARCSVHVGANSERKVFPRRNQTGESWVLARPEYWAGAQWRNINLPGRVRSGHDLTWDGANIAFEILHTGHGVDYRVTLKNATNATNVRWALTLVGLTWDDWKLISNATGQVVTVFRIPTMTDANGVERSVAAEYSGGYITYTPDYSGLTYPVVIQ